MTDRYIVVKRRLGADGMYATSDGIRHASAEAAIAHGEDVTGSDDFNIGVVADGRIKELRWMDRVVGMDSDDLDRINAMLAGSLRP